MKAAGVDVVCRFLLVLVVLVPVVPGCGGTCVAHHFMGRISETVRRGSSFAQLGLIKGLHRGHYISIAIPYLFGPATGNVLPVLNLDEGHQCCGWSMTHERVYNGVTLHVQIVIATTPWSPIQLHVLP